MTILRTITELLVTNLVELVMLSVGLGARPGQVLALVRRRELLARELFVLVIGVPLLTLLVVRMLPIPPWTGVVAVLFGISPTAPFLLYAFRRRTSAADKALAVVVVSLASSVVIVPMWIAILNRVGGFELRVSPMAVLRMLAWKVFAPLLVGAAIRRCAPTIAHHAGRVLSVVVALALTVTVVLMLYLGVGTLRLVTFPILVGLVLIATGSALLGELAGGRDLELREILGRAAMNGNPAIALAIIGTSYPELDLGGLVAAYLVGRGVATMPYVLITRYRLSRRRSPVEPPPSASAGAA